MPVSGDDNHKKVSINAAFLLEAALPDTRQNSIDQTVPNRNTWNQLSVFNSAPERWSNAHDILTRNWYQKLVPENWYQNLVPVAGFLVPEIWYQKQTIMRIKQNKFLNLIIFPVYYYE